MKRLFAILLAMAVLLSCSACGPRLTEDEAYVRDILTAYREILVDPDSLVLRGDVALVRGTDHTYCYFVASGKNDRGQELTSTICYLDGEFFCDMEEMAVFLENGLGTTDTVMDIDLLIRCQTVQEAYEQWETDGNITVSGETIAGTLKLPWEAAYG